MTMKTYSRKKTKLAADITPPEISSKTSPVAELIANNVDLLIQILLRLPAKSVIRFKSVSKKWLSHLSDYRFASTHSHLNPRPLVSTVFYYNKIQLDSVSLKGSSTVPSLSFLHRLTRDFTILQSCNGLLLIKDKQMVNRCPKPRYTVCNPTTQKFHVLVGHDGDFYKSCGLAFDPSKSPHYKVVLLIYRSYIHRFDIDIYSSETACWKKIVLHNGQMDGCYGKGAFWNGALYWLCGENHVLRFDVETEKIIWISYEQHTSNRILSLDKTRYFGECGRGGRLLLIQSDSYSTMRLKICEMDEDHRRWNVKLPVDLKTLISEFPEIETQVRYKFTMMCAVEGEKEDDIVLILAIPGKIISYNPQKGTCNVLRDLALGEYIGFIDGYTYANVFLFVESLSPV